MYLTYLEATHAQTNAQPQVTLYGVEAVTACEATEMKAIPI